MIRAEGLDFSYPGGVSAIRGVSFSVDPGESLYLVGSSGAGKTTLLRLLLGLAKPLGGRLQVLGIDLTEASSAELRQVRCATGAVFQDFRLFKGQSAYDNVAVSLRILGIRGNALQERTLAALRSVRLEDLAERPVERLSWGQQQRVALARALVRHPGLVIADEPTGNLDEENTKIVADLLIAAREEGAAVVVATHDPALLEAAPGRMVRLVEGTAVGQEEVV